MQEDLKFSFIKFFLFIIFDFYLGYLWHDTLFGELWLREQKIKREDIEKTHKAGDMWKYFLGQICINIVSIFIQTWLLILFNPQSILNAVLLAFSFWLAFVFNVHFRGMLWEGKSLLLTMINSGNLLVSMTIYAAFYFYF